MNTKKQKVMAFVLSFVLACSSFLEFVVPVQAAQSGFATGAAITSDTALEYCWNDSTVTLSVVALTGTEVEWSITKADGSEAEGITLEEISDTDAANGVSKNVAVNIGATASGSYIVTATASEDQPRKCTLNVVDTMTEIVGAVETDFNNQFTSTNFTVKTVVDKRYADALVWSSSDEKVTVEPLNDKSDGATYPGSIIKYAKVTMASEKPEGGQVVVTAATNGKTKERPIVVKKAATGVKDVKVTACDNGEDIKVKTHMDDDTIYVDMDETIVLSGIVEGTLIEYDEDSSSYVADDNVILSCTENDSNFSGSLTSLTKISDTSYSFEYSITGIKATEGKYRATVLTQSGQASKSYNLMVLAPVSQIGICREENYSIFEKNLQKYDVLENEDNTKYLVSKTQMAKADDLDGNTTSFAKGTTMTEGFSLDLAAVFRGKFDKNKQYICATTDTIEWASADKNIVEVGSDGKLTAIRSGSTTISCYAKETPTSSRKELCATYDVTVEAFKPATKITITKGTGTTTEVVSKDAILTNQANVENKYNVILQTETGEESNDECTWESSDEKVFTVDANGYVTPVASGTATLTARTINSGISANVEITVLAAAETLSIATNLSGAAVEGHTYKFVAKANDGADESEELTWTSADDKVVFLDPNDASKTEYSEFVGRACLVLVKATSGTAKITVKGKYLSSAIATRSFTCAEAVEAETVSIYQGESDVSAKTISVTKGNNLVLTAQLLGKDKIPSNDDYEWSIVGDDDGAIVKAKSDLYNTSTLTLEPQTKGTVNVQLRDLQTNRLTTVTINVLVPATELSLKETNEKLTLALGDSYSLQPTVVPVDTSDVVKYESSNPEIVSVNENGKLTALAYSEEIVTITASINDTLTATVKVNVAIPIEDIEVKDDLGHVLTDNSNITMMNKDDLVISLQCGDATEVITWNTNSETVASLQPSEDTYSCVIHANKAGYAIVTATSSVTGTTMNFRITVVTSATDINNTIVRIKDSAECSYNGTEIKPEVTVEYSGLQLIQDVDYTLSYEDNVNAGNGKIVITGIGDFSGTKKQNFTIKRRDFSNVTASTVASVAYTGTFVKPTVNVTDLGKKLVEGTDYTVSYMNNSAVGTATILIYGTGANYSGSKMITFKITTLNISKVKVAKIANQKYTGKAITPWLTITNGTTSLSENRDYTVKWSSNKKPGKAKAVITGKGNYTGSKTVYFYIAPATPQLRSVNSTAAKSMKIKWKKDTKATGYEIYYATTSNFAKKGRKTVAISKNKTTSKTVKKLKSNKTYYVKIRSYKKVGSKKIYSDWSNVMNVQVK